MLRNKKISILLITSAICLQAINCWPVFYLFTKENAKNPEIITTRSQFDRSKETIFLIHGFADNGLNAPPLVIKDALLKSLDVNVISVDWEDGAAAPNYPKAVSNARVVGTKIADFVKVSGIDLTHVHCIGHSLGAHACGFAGKITKFKRITGLLFFLKILLFMIIIKFLFIPK